MPAKPRTTPADNVTRLQDKPAKVHFSLLDLEAEQPGEVFTVEVAEGVTVTLTDPEQLTAEEMMTLSSNPLVLFRYVASVEDQEHLIKLRGPQLKELIRAYYAHFGMGADGGKAPGGSLF